MKIGPKAQTLLIIMGQEVQIVVLNWIGAAGLFGCLVRVLLATNVFRTGISSNDVALIVISGLYGVPLVILASISGDVDYPAPMFSAAAGDVKVATVQTIFLLGTAILLAIFRRPQPLSIIGATKLAWVKRRNDASRLLSVIGQVLLLVSGLLAFFAPEPETYLQYGFYSRAGTRHLVSDDMALWHSRITACTVLSVICTGVGYLLGTAHQKDWWSTVRFACTVALASWLNGKRNSLAIAMFFGLLALILKRRVRVGSKVFFSLIFILFFGIYSSWYQSRRGLSDVNTIESYLINYGRDHGLRMAIFSELNNEPILEYRGQSFLFNLCLPVPRSYWADKPWPYATYFTSKAFCNHQLFVYPWQFTTSWLGECVANLGLYGLFFGPLSLVGLCRINDNIDRPFVRVAGYLVISLLLAVHIPAFYFLFCGWIAAVCQRYFCVRPVRTSSCLDEGVYLGNVLRKAPDLGHLKR